MARIRARPELCTHPVSVAEIFKKVWILINFELWNLVNLKIEKWFNHFLSYNARYLFVFLFLYIFQVKGTKLLKNSLIKKYAMLYEAGVMSTTSVTDRRTTKDNTETIISPVCSAPLFIVHIYLPQLLIV